MQLRSECVARAGAHAAGGAGVVPATFAIAREQGAADAHDRLPFGGDDGLPRKDPTKLGDQAIGMDRHRVVLEGVTGGGLVLLAGLAQLRKPARLRDT